TRPVINTVAMAGNNQLFMLGRIKRIVYRPDHNASSQRQSEKAESSSLQHHTFYGQALLPSQPVHAHFQSEHDESVHVYGNLSIIAPPQLAFRVLAGKFHQVAKILRINVGKRRWRVVFEIYNAAAFTRVRRGGTGREAGQQHEEAVPTPSVFCERLKLGHQNSNLSSTSGAWWPSTKDDGYLSDERLNLSHERYHR
ncbi:MAG: hypothetical protein VW647_11790, partial [Alphaproteobacteria bacterium]